MKPPLVFLYPIFALLLGKMAYSAELGRIDKVPEGFPPLPESRREVYEYYKLAFMPDGYPGKEMSGGKVIPHPIYGAYIISDYIRQFRKTGQNSFLQAACKVADLSIGRMERFHDALVFWYPPEDGLLSYPDKIYSSLTQSQYLTLFAKLYHHTHRQEYQRAAEKILNGLRIPTSQGGVLYVCPEGGAVMEEAPHEAPQAVLNGWLTAIERVNEYHRMTGSRTAKTLYEDNMKALERLLPLYDVPEALNSRYRLAGFDDFRLDFSDSVSGRMRGLCVAIPRVGKIAFRSQSENLWDNRIISGATASNDGSFAFDGKRVQGNLVLSMISHPDPNHLEMEIECDRDTTLTLRLGDGDYVPLSSSLITSRWRDIATARLRKGNNRVSLAIPWKEAQLVAYPTNFLKKVGKMYHNSYHYLHIISLHALYRRTRRPIFYEYWRKWLGYTHQWPTASPYKDVKDIRLDYYIPGTYSAFDPASLRLDSVSAPKASADDQ